MFLCLLTHLTTFCFRYNIVCLKSVRDSEDIIFHWKVFTIWRWIADNFNIIRDSMGQGWVLVLVGLNRSLPLFSYTLSRPDWKSNRPLSSWPPKMRKFRFSFQRCWACSLASHILQHWNLANVLMGRLNVCLRQAPSFQ